MKKMRTVFRTTAVLLCAAMLFLLVGCGKSSSESTSNYPNSAITMIVNYSAGGGTDLASRALADAAASYLGGTITITNISGGTGSLGVEELAKSDADGYTIGVATLAPLSIVPFQLDVSYTPDSFEYICTFAQYGYGIVVPADSPYETLDDLIAAAKESPINFGATGYPQPITMNTLGNETGASFNFVSYSETTDLVTDVLGGFITCACADMASFAAYVKSGDMRLLASAHGQRWDVAPEVKTLQEMGYEAICDSYMGICVPAGTPEDIVKTLREAFAVAVEDETYVEIVNNANHAIAYMSGEDYEAMVREYYEFYSTFDFESAG